MWAIWISLIVSFAVVIVPTTYRNVKYRLLQGDRATGIRLVGLSDASRFTWNALKEAREIQYSHACRRTIESPTFFTLGKAFKALWDAERCLQSYSYAVVRDPLKYQSAAWPDVLLWPQRTSEVETTPWHAVVSLILPT